MTTPQKISYITVDEYLASEERASIKHEYLDGRVFAMTGATARHNIIIQNLSRLIHNHIRGSACRAYFNDMKVRVERNNSFYYPDVVVACGKFKGSDVIAPEPTLIIEVQSLSTAATDRREKAQAYRQIPTLREYLIVYQRLRKAELHRRNADGAWEVAEYVPSADLVLESLPNGPVAVAWDAIYEEADVPWEKGREVREHAGFGWGEDDESEYAEGEFDELEW